MRSVSSFFGVNTVYLAVAGGMILHAYSLPGEGGLVPLVIGIPTAFMCVGSMIRCARAGTQEAEPREASADEDDVAGWKDAWIVAAWLASLVLGVFFAGFYVSIPVFVVAYVRFSAGVGWRLAVALALVLWGVVYGSFDLILQRPLFEGVLFGAILPLL